ncbi:MAG: DUF2975 domain-containing protein [Hyphomonadaceae bacterium]|nr:DUF2975 domain-containing protein [Hyphomonadaceae bacterium]
MKALGRGSIASWLEIALNVVWAILWVGLVGVVLGAIAFAVVMGLIAGGVLSVDILEGGRGHVSSGAAEITFSTDGGLPWQIVAPALAAAAAAVSGGLIIVDRLKRLFASFRSAEPFRKENATHLRVIWVTMLAIELSRYALLGLTGVLIAAFGEPKGTDWSFSFHMNLMTWAAILVLIVLAEVFREGARLREEQDLTI